MFCCLAYLAVWSQHSKRQCGVDREKRAVVARLGSEYHEAQQREELRTAWETRNIERSAALAPFADREATRRAGRAYGQGLTRSRHGDDRFGGPGRGAPEPD